jgi:hypothetical protein
MANEIKKVEIEDGGANVAVQYEVAGRTGIYRCSSETTAADVKAAIVAKESKLMTAKTLADDLKRAPALTFPEDVWALIMSSANVETEIMGG